MMEGVVLYSGNTTSTVTLSESSANFERIKVYFSTANGSYDSTEVFSPNGKVVNLFSGNRYENMVNIQNALVTISGTSITWNQNARGDIVNGAAGAVYTTGTHIYIRRVVGYKW